MAMSLACDVIAEAAALGLTAESLGDQETTTLLHRLWEAFGQGKSPPARRLWTCLRPGETFHAPDAWKSLGEYIREIPVVLSAML